MLHIVYGEHLLESLVYKPVIEILENLEGIVLVRFPYPYDYNYRREILKKISAYVRKEYLEFPTKPKRPFIYPKDLTLHLHSTPPPKVETMPRVYFLILLFNPNIPEPVYQAIINFRNERFVPIPGAEEKSTFLTLEFCLGFTFPECLALSRFFNLKVRDIERISDILPFVVYPDLFPKEVRDIIQRGQRKRNKLVQIAAKLIKRIADAV